jgi:hypothetical protein
MTSKHRDERSGDAILLLAFFLSGAAALGYELLWTRLLGLALGSETIGMLATLAGFFGGMALGAAALHRRAESSPNPVRLFITLELVAAAFAVASPFLLTALARLLPPLLGPVVGAADQGPALLVSLLVATAVLLPGTVCLGATLAALVVARRRANPRDSDARGLGRLYAANTAGATAGVLLAVYLVLPALGYALGALVPAALGLAAAVLAHRWARGRDLSPGPGNPHLSPRTCPKRQPHLPLRTCPKRQPQRSTPATTPTPTSCASAGCSWSSPSAPASPPSPSRSSASRSSPRTSRTPSTPSPTSSPFTSSATPSAPPSTSASPPAPSPVARPPSPSPCSPPSPPSSSPPPASCTPRPTCSPPSPPPTRASPAPSRPS